MSLKPLIAGLAQSGASSPLGTANTFTATQTIDGTNRIYWNGLLCSIWNDGDVTLKKMHIDCEGSISISPGASAVGGHILQLGNGTRVGETINIQRNGDATSGTTITQSKQFIFSTSYWSGSAAVIREIGMQATTTTGGLNELYFIPTATHDTTTTGVLSGSKILRILEAGVVIGSRTSAPLATLDLQAISGTEPLIVRDSSGNFRLRNSSNSWYFGEAGVSRVGIGALGTTDRSYLAIRAGTTSDGQLRLESGVAPTSPATGEIWNDGSNVAIQGIGLSFNSVGKGLTYKSGTGARAGNATLVGGTVTVTNTTVTANTIVMLTRKTSGGTIGTAITYTLSAATSFTINSDNPLDTSTFSYVLHELV